MKDLFTLLSVRWRARAALWSATRLDTLPIWCGSRESSGVDETPDWRDWTDQETTPDQLRIEDVLEGEQISGKAILHVGIGNSSLAQRFHQTARVIDGITIQEQELSHARDLDLRNYRPMLGNRYSPSLLLRLKCRYDYIVDNNPTTFCCCRTHLSTMLASYSSALKTDGVILTDKVGLHWTSEPNDPRWRVSEGEWRALGRAFGLDAVRYTDFVIGLRKGPRLRNAIRSASALARIRHSSMRV